MEFPIIESNRIILRALAEFDSALLFDIYSNQNAMKFWDSEKHVDISVTHTMLTEMQNSWPTNKGISWALVLKKSNTLIGQFTIHSWHKKNKIAKLGYIINPHYWDKGYGSEALNRVVDFAFSEFNLNSILAELDPKNSASAAILIKKGFQLSETKLNDLMVNGIYYDTHVYLLCNTTALN